MVNLNPDDINRLKNLIEMGVRTKMEIKDLGESLREATTDVAKELDLPKGLLNKAIAKIAHDQGKHYFDLTEDVDTTNYIRSLAETSKGVMAPQCGLAPGLIGIIGADLTKDFTKLRDIELRVGALPRYPNGLLAVRGEKWLRLNQGDEYIRFSGVVRKQDISPNNTVESERVADARITYSGTGDVAAGSEQGWVSRLLNSSDMPY